jgi:hypothetical protein
MSAGIEQLLNRLSKDNRIFITAGTLYEEHAAGFFIDVKTEGSVHYTTWGGQTNTETLSKGYHPFRIRKIFADTAVDVAVNF